MPNSTASPPDKADSSFYINDALNSRAIGPAIPVAEKQALQALAAVMAVKPADVLPKLVELAMALTGSSSAGLSLYEPDPAPGVFRWRHLHGLLAPFEDATTPRNDSPCGVTLDRRNPTLSAHPELIYNWISDAGIVVPEVLLVPLYVGGQDPVGTLWIVASEEGHFHQGHAETATELADFAGIALKMIRDETRLREALDEQELLAKEMSHRLKNLFAMTDGIIRASAREAENVKDMAESLSGRVHALAKAHSLVQRKAGDIGSETFTDLADLITTLVGPHERPGETRRLFVDGPPMPCGEHATNAFALVFHELATNAAKYGALSNATGKVTINWLVTDGQLILRWQEEGGPPVTKPTRVGFGTNMLAMTVERQFDGMLSYDWSDDGLGVTIAVEANKLSY